MEVELYNVQYISESIQYRIPLGLFILFILHVGGSGVLLNIICQVQIPRLCISHLEVLGKGSCKL